MRTPGRPEQSFDGLDELLRRMGSSFSAQPSVLVRLRHFSYGNTSCPQTLCGEVAHHRLAIVRRRSNAYFC